MILLRSTHEYDAKDNDEDSHDGLDFDVGFTQYEIGDHESEKRGRECDCGDDGRRIR